MKRNRKGVKKILRNKNEGMGIKRGSKVIELIKVRVGQINEWNKE